MLSGDGDADQKYGYANHASSKIGSITSNGEAMRHQRDLSNGQFSSLLKYQHQTVPEIQESMWSPTYIGTVCGMGLI